MALKQTLFGGHAHPTFLGDLLVTGARFIVGLSLALGHGLGKMPPADRFVAGVEAMGLPMPVVLAWAAAFAEFFGGILLAAGLFTRPAAFFIACTMSVAGFIAHAADPFQKKELAFMYLAASLIFLALGSGRFGVDRFLRGGAAVAQSSKAKKSK